MVWLNYYEECGLCFLDNTHRCHEGQSAAMDAVQRRNGLFSTAEAIQSFLNQSNPF